MKVLYEKITHSHDTSLRVCRVGGRSFGAPYHAHPEIEVTWICSGAGDLVVGDYFGRFTEGDVIVQGGGLPHAYRRGPGSRAETVFVQFLASDFGQPFWNMPEMRAVKKLLHLVERGLRLSPAASRLAATGLESLTLAKGPQRIALLLQILAQAAEDRRAKPLAAVGYAPPRDAAGATRVAKILAALEAGWRGEADLTSVARDAGMHPRSLSRFCRRHLKKSFSELLIGRRLGEASRLLIETDASISEIAFSTGFNNLSNFNRLFRAARGMPPGTFRSLSV